MRILGLDTATAATTVALLDTADGRAVQRRDDPPPGERPRHTTRLLPLALEVLREAGLGWGDVDRLAVGVGPGTFTGLRIGIATALALAAAREIPLVGVSTLHSLAAGTVAETDGSVTDVVAVIDARRREVFAAGWAAADAADPAASPWLAPAAMAPDALAETVSRRGRPWLAIGDGAVGFKEVLRRAGARIPPSDSERNRVSALEHCRLAVGLDAEAPEGVRPEYLRLPDAEITLRAARQR